MTDLREQLQELLGDTYRLERELSGGMSRVFVAEETALARKVVIKVLPPDMAASVNVSRFRREIQLAASLQHPHIVPLLTAGAKGDLLYYVMPLIEGESLRSRLLKKGEFPVSDVAWILRDAASALAYAHSHGVVHRDIKPDNILLTGKFAVVTDFGVAKAVSEATSDFNITSQGVALGTPTYMAPEQAAADPNTDHRADIYALGVVGYELLAGTPPFVGTSQQMILAAHISRAPENVTSLRASVPPALASVVMRCLEKKPADRYQTAEELAQQLSTIATSGSTTPASTEPWIPAAQRATRRSHRSAIAAAFVLGIASVAAVAWFTNRSEAPVFDDRRVIVSDFENVTRDAALDPVGRLASDLLRQGITQTGIAEVAAATEATGDSARAGLIVRGQYYKEADSVRMQAEILDARTSRVVRAITPVKASLASPSTAIELLRPRILGAIASLNDPLIRNWARQATEPPKYEAYRAYRAGLDADVPRTGQTAGIDGSANDAEQEKAILIDSIFVLPILELWFPPELDRAYAQRHRMTPVDRFLIEAAWMWRKADYESALKAYRQAANLAPDPVILMQQAQMAIYAGYPNEAVAASTKADPGGQLQRGWGIRTDAFHLVNDLQSELKAVQREKELGLNTDYEFGQVLPALGRVEEVNALIKDRMRKPSLAEDTPAALMMFAAREYRAHGFVKESDELANRAIAWYQSRPDDEMTEGRSFNLVSALIHAGRLAEAKSLMEKVLRAHPNFRNEPTTFEILGRIAARLGDTTTARSYMDRLRAVKASITPGGGRTSSAYSRALIAAGLGDRATAAALLQQAFAEGNYFEPYLHREIEFQAIQDYPPLKELLWPKG
jgi:serine/threonine protein kinase/tetratricopeptide (TPR) repeat protein